MANILVSFSESMKKLIRRIVIIFLIVVAFSMFFGRFIIVIPPGHGGIVFHVLGKGLDTETVYGDGLHVILPWNQMYIYDGRLKEVYETMDVLSKNGLKISIDLSSRFRPVKTQIGHIHEDIGKNYMDKVVRPEIRSATREVIGQYLPEELYSTKRETIQEEIFAQSKEALEKKNIVLDAILIRSVILPDSLAAAIEHKLEEEQESFRYDFRILKEEKEADRKIIEATAKAEANRILSASLTDKILRDKGIDATLELAKSQNSKVVIVGGEGDGLPLILGGDK